MKRFHDSMDERRWENEWAKTITMKDAVQKLGLVLNCSRVINNEKGIKEDIKKVQQVRLKTFLCPVMNMREA